MCTEKREERPGGFVDPETLLWIWGTESKESQDYRSLDPRIVQSSRWRQCQAALLGELHVGELGLVCKLTLVSSKCGWTQVLPVLRTVVPGELV